MNKVLCFIVFFCAVLFLSCNSKKESKDYDGRVFEAQTVEGVDMTFEIISVADKTVQVGTGDNEKPAISKDYSGQITIPQEVQGYKVVRIGANAFSNCNITSAIIQEGVRVIEQHAFNGCENLKKVKFPKTLTAIEEYAFVNTSLSVIHIPKSVSHIGNHALRSVCTTKIEVDVDNEYYDSREDCNAIIETASNILIVGCKNTKIPESVVEIGCGAFTFSEELYEIEIPSNIKGIGEAAFSGCHNLYKVILHNGLETIGERAFQGTGIASIHIPKTVKMIGERFLMQTKISHIVVESGNPKYDSRNECNAIIETTSNKLLVGCKNSVVPSSVQQIGESAFVYSDIERITLHETISSIGIFAFAHCKNIQEVKSMIQDPFPVPSAFSLINEEARLLVPRGSKEKYQQTKGWDEFKEIVEME